MAKFCPGRLVICQGSVKKNVTIMFCSLLTTLALALHSEPHRLASYAK